jgi:alpha-1,6-mannosyl-glycoprotein beta-1,2-N-acetylglucosaminyltransferase
MILHRKIRIFLKLIPVFILLSFVYITISKSMDQNSPISSSNPNPESAAFQISGSSNTGGLSMDEIRDQIWQANMDEKVLNAGSSFSASNITAVIVVQVHDRSQYLSGLIHSLSNVKGISNTLLIFSHDVFDQEINNMIMKIKFCPVTQIFYPFSMQLSPDSFPGPDPKDCPRDISVKDAAKIKCHNYKHPDTYGHYREARYTQTKHHWFWKGNHLFNNMRLLQNFTGPVVFLEEDHFVAPDMVHFVKLMLDFREHNCKSCLLTLGSYAKSISFAKNGDKVEIKKWFSSRHNMGLVFDKSSWSDLKSCAEKFCTYDDYNWDWSLQFVSQDCYKEPIRVVAASTARVFHLGECGVHHRDCSKDHVKVQQKIEDVLMKSKDYLFPKSISLIKTPNRNTRMPKVNGGWSDKRDHILCLSFLDQSVKPVHHPKRFHRKTDVSSNSSNKS